MTTQQPESELFSDEFHDLRDKYGSPFILGKDGGVSGINQRFFAALYCHVNKLVFDREEKKFFLYDHSTGLWQEQTPQQTYERKG